MDPLAQLVNLLRPKTLLWKRIEGRGSWGLTFRANEEVNFGTVLSGSCLLLRAGKPPLPIRTGDFLLQTKPLTYTLASDAHANPEDAETALAASSDRQLKLGTGAQISAEVLGGHFTFESVNRELLTDLLPPLVHVPSTDKVAGRVRSMLALAADESKHTLPGSDVVLGHLMEIILIEILRSGLAHGDARPQGMFAALIDPQLAVVLRAIHQNVARPWTVAQLARLAGMSRSVFAARFREAVGKGPIDYLLTWRMAIAKDAIRGGGLTFSEVALSVGYQSAGAFSTAFKRVVGCSPKVFADSVRDPRTRLGISVAMARSSPSE